MVEAGLCSLPMIPTHLTRYAGMFALVIFASAASAKQAPQCSGLIDDSQRLACYDAAFGKPAPAPPLAPAAPAAVTKPATSPPVKTSVEASARIVKLDKRADSRFVVTLDNGQSWLQLERDSSVEVAVGDTVTVLGGLFGSHFLVTRSGARVRITAAK
jgi:hypothetical protein